MRKPSESDTYCYTVEQFRAMVDHCRSKSELAWLADIILALALTGIRISELASLHPDNIDFERNVFVLKDERRRKISLRRAARTVKSGRDRVFPIHHQLREVLVRACRVPGTRAVFRAFKGGVLRADNVRAILIKRVIAPLKERFPSPDDEIGFKDGRLHSYRHFFASECANRGVPEQVLMNWLGHQSSAMVRRYYHLSDQESQRQIKKLDFLDGLAGQ